MQSKNPNYLRRAVVLSSSFSTRSFLPLSTISKLTANSKRAIRDDRCAVHCAAFHFATTAESVQRRQNVFRGISSSRSKPAAKRIDGDPGAVTLSEDTTAEVPYDVFISHAGEDKETIATPLYQALEEAGVKTFFDREELRVGDHAPKNMIAAMNNALCGVFILSPEFVAKKWPMDELYCFLRRQKDSETLGCELRGLPGLVPVFHRLTLAECQFKSSQNLFDHQAFAMNYFNERMRNGETNQKKVKDALQQLSKYNGIESQPGADTAQMIQAIKSKLCGQLKTLRLRHETTDLGHLLRKRYKDSDFTVIRALFGRKTLDVKDLECTLRIINDARNKTTDESIPLERSEFIAYEERKKWIKVPIPIEDLYQQRIIMPGEPAKNITKLLVVGGAGMGKTTLSKKLAYRWSIGTWGLQFRAVYLLPVRKLQANEYDNSSYRKEATLPTAIVNNCFAPPTEEFAYKALRKKIDAYLELSTTLVILDGLDERAGVQEALITRAINGKHKLLMLSRAYNMEVERTMADMEIELTGLSEEQVKHYVLKVSDMDQEQGEKLINLLARDRTISEIVQVPVNLQILCYLWDDILSSTAVKNALDQGSLSLLYHTVTREIWERYVKEVKELPERKKEAKEVGLPTDNCTGLFDTLSEIAFRALEKGEILIDKKLVQSLTDVSVQDTLQVLQDSGFLLFQGLGEHYQFAHLTFQEYFAGRWLARQLLSNVKESKEEVELFFTEHKYTPQYGRMFSFMAGELSNHGKKKNGRSYKKRKECIQHLLLNAKENQQGMFKCIQLQMRLLHEWCLQHDDAKMAQDFDVQNMLAVLFRQGIDAVREGDYGLISQLTSLLTEFTAAAKHVCSDSLVCLQNHSGDSNGYVRRISVDTLRQVSPSMPAQCFGPLSFVCQSLDDYVCITSLEALVEVLKADNTFAAGCFEIFQKAYESRNALVRKTALVGLSEATKANTTLASKFFTICFPALNEKAVRRAASYSLMAVIPQAHKTMIDDMIHQSTMVGENGDIYVQALVIRALTKGCEVDPTRFRECLPLLLRSRKEGNEYIRWLCRQLARAESLSNPLNHSNVAPLHPGEPFGKEEWMVFFGDVGKVPPLPQNMHEILNSKCPFWEGRKVFETHLLVLIPSTVDEEPYSLNLLEDMIKFPQKGENRTQFRHYNSMIKSQLGRKSPQKPYWVLMTHDVIPDSRTDDYEKQKKMVMDHAERTGLPYQLPSALEAATAILMYYVRTGTHLFPLSPWTHTCCKDVIKFEQDGSNASAPALVGEFFSKGLYVNFYIEPSVNFHGVACLHRLEGP